MKHSNDGGVLKGAHQYKNGSYQEVKDFVPSEYPKYHSSGKVVKSAEEEAALDAPKGA